MKSIACLAFLIATWCPAAPTTETPVSEELTNQEFLFKVIRYLYRWHLDESHADIIVRDKEAVFLVREDHPAVDPDDQSRFGTIILPQVGYTVTLKKADYQIQELGLEAHSESFEIVNVAAFIMQDELEGFQTVTLPYDEILEYAHRLRSKTQFPEGLLLEEMRKEARREILSHIESRQAQGLPFEPRGYDSLESFLAAPQEIYLAPMPEIANDQWIYWETGQMLLHFSTELDLQDPALWGHEHLNLKIFDLENQTVTSLHEVAGSNAFLTRDKVGRILYNCLVLGKRMVLDPKTISD